MLAQQSSIRLQGIPDSSLSFYSSVQETHKLGVAVENGI